MNDKTSIRDIKLSSKREKIEYANKHRVIADKNLASQGNFVKKNKNLGLKIFLFSIILLLIFGGISIFLHSAKIIITPKTQEVVFTEMDTYQAVANEKNEKEKNIIRYELVNFSFSVEKNMKSIGVEEKKEKATGKIKIINNSTRTQKLRKETRFRNNGRIFMTYKSTTIPANSFLIAPAFSVEAGAEYNLPVGTKFDIPGFEEAKSPLFAKMSGEVAEAFSGGIIGKNNIPHKDDLKLNQRKALEELKIKADSEISQQIEDNYILVDSTSFRKFSENLISQDEKVILNSTVDIQAIVFPKIDFIKMILNLEEEENDLGIKNIDTLSFNITSDNFSVEKAEDFNFTLGGRAEVYWHLDQKSFLSKVRGKTKKEITESLQNNFKNFAVDISVTPIWRSKIPNNLEKIKIKIMNN